MSKIVFHSPLEVMRPGLSGSAVRPLKILEAFQAIGLEVVLCDGASGERLNKIKDAISLNGSSDVIGIYSELATLPLALTDPDHLPRALNADFRLFQRARSEGIPVAAFYRDLHWRFPEYASGKSRWKEIVKLPFHHLEVWQLYRSVDHVFLPSTEMADYMPGNFKACHSSALPPGSPAIKEFKENPQQGCSKLNLLYIGGVVPPLYNLDMMFRAVGGLSGVNFTLCCREQEWRLGKAEYPPISNVSIVHQHGEALSKLYEKADIFLMAFEPTEYMNFAMPVKLFEAIGWGLPIIASTDSAAGNFVKTEGCGWTVGSQQELSDLITRLKSRPELVTQMKTQVRKARDRHTWNARAAQVLKVLERYRIQGLRK